MSDERGIEARLAAHREACRLVWRDILAALDFEKVTLAKKRERQREYQRAWRAKQRLKLQAWREQLARETPVKAQPEGKKTFAPVHVIPPGVTLH